MTETQAVKTSRANVYTKRSKNNYGFSCFVKRKFLKGECVMSGFGKIINHQTSQFSIQMDWQKHFLPKKWTGRYWNHSCNPNAFIQTRKDGFPDLIALKNIEKDEEITYGYYMTEYKWSKKAMESHIKCKCNQKGCRKKIFSFSQLSQKDQEQFIKKKLCSKYLKHRLR